MNGFANNVRTLRSLQKPARGTPGYTLFVNRPLGQLVAAACPRWVSPSLLTLASAILAFAGLALVWLSDSSAWITPVAAALVVIAYILDSADGQLARLHGLSSKLGEWLDHTIDAGKIAFFHITVAAFLVRSEVIPPISALLIGAGFLVTAVWLYTGSMLSMALVPIESRRNISVSGNLKAVLLSPTDPGILNLTLFLLTWPAIFLCVYILLGIAALTYLVLLAFKWGTELARVDQQGEQSN